MVTLRPFEVLRTRGQPVSSVSELAAGAGVGCSPRARMESSSASESSRRRFMVFPVLEMQQPGSGMWGNATIVPLAGGEAKSFDVPARRHALCYIPWVDVLTPYRKVAPCPRS